MVTTGPKWNGKSTYQLRLSIENSSRIAAAKRLVEQQLNKGIEEEETKIKQELVRLIGRKDLDWQDIERGWSWECPTSPTGNCVYDTASDPMKDNCLFCGEPVDRG